MKGDKKKRKKRKKIQRNVSLNKDYCLMITKVDWLKTYQTENVTSYLQKQNFDVGMSKNNTWTTFYEKLKLFKGHTKD